MNACDVTEQLRGVFLFHSALSTYLRVLSNQHGDLVRSLLRPGNVHSADGWEGVLKPVVACYQRTGKTVAFRGDAAFAQPSMYEYLESLGIEYAIRLPANQVLQARIADLLTRRVGRPPHSVLRFYRSFRYGAKSWSRPRHVDCQSRVASG